MNDEAKSDVKGGGNGLFALVDFRRGAEGERLITGRAGGAPALDS
jgi:hypothetical protein